MGCGEQDAAASQWCKDGWMVVDVRQGIVQAKSRLETAGSYNKFRCEAMLTVGEMDDRLLNRD